MPISRRRFIATTVAASAALATPVVASVAPSDPAVSTPDLTASPQYDLFSDRARQVIQLANQERVAMNHWHVGTEHLLLALFAESEASGTHWLEETGVHYDDISCVADHVIGTGDSEIGGYPVKSDNMQACLDNAIDLACDLGHPQVRPEHLMLSIVESFGTTANMLLQEMWMERGHLRQVTAESLA